MTAPTLNVLAGSMRYCASHWTTVVRLYRTGLSIRRIRRLVPPCEVHR